MPSLTPASEDTLALARRAEGAQTLAPLAAGAQSLAPVDELEYASTTHLGFFPDTALVEAPYPYPGSTSYPGDTVVTTVGHQLGVAPEGSLNLTPRTEA